MAFDFHKDKKRYFDIQYKTSRDFIIPFVEQKKKIVPSHKVLEIGCGEAGVLKAFLERGCECVGIELSEQRVKTASQFLEKEVNEGGLKLISRDIYDIDPEKDISFKFDIIILKDVIEHIYHQDKFIPLLKGFLNPGGQIFFSFPPWYMPFGGHQQTCNSKILSKLPYYHLLPMPLYKGILSLLGESEGIIKGLEEVKDTGISIERFERIVKQSKFMISERRFYLFNPIYKFKFNLKPRRQYGLISMTPYIRNFFTSAMYYLVE